MLTSQAPVRPKIKIKYASKLDQHAVLKWASVDGASVVVTGETYEDHEVWRVDGDEISVIGTLTSSTFKAMMRLRKGSRLTLHADSSEMEWVEPSVKDRTFEGVGVSIYALSKDLTDRTYQLRGY